MLTVVKLKQAADDDPPGLLDKTDVLLRDWVQIYHTSQAARDPTKAFSIFVHQMNVNGILKTDDLITRFFRLSTQVMFEVIFGSLVGLVRFTCTSSFNATGSKRIFFILCYI